MHLSVDRHLGCFHVLAIVNSDTVFTGVHVSFWVVGCFLFFFFFPGLCPGVGLLDHMRALFLIFKGTSILFSIPICISTNSQWAWGGVPFSTSSSAFIVCRFFDNDHLDQCELIPHCSFDFHFSNNKWCWASFHMPLGHLYVFFGEMSI